MFNNFEGSVKPRRQINLGGQRSQEDKKLLLKRTQEQRKAREAERLRNKSANKIQAFYRGRKVANDIRQIERVNWDQHARAFFNNLEETNAETAYELINLIRSFLFFYRPHLDNQRELCLCQILSQHRKGSQTLFLPFAREELRETWNFQLKQTLLIFLKSIGFSHDLDQTGINEYLIILRSAIDISKYEQITGIMEGSKTVKTIMEHLVSNGLYQGFRKQILTVPIDKSNSSSRNLIADLLMTPIKSEIRDIALPEFIKQIFTIPLLPMHITITNLPIEAILSNIINMATDQFQTEEICSLLGNSLIYALPKVDSFKKLTLLAYLKVLQNLSSIIPAHLLAEKYASNSNGMMIDEDEDEEDLDMLMVTSSSSKEIIIDQQVLQAIEKLFDQKHLSSIFSFATKADTDSLLKVANFLVTLMIKWPSRKDELLKAMIHGHALKWKGKSATNEIWQEFKSTELAQKVKSQLFSSSIVTDKAFAEQWGLLALLCELLSRILFVTGDDEFFQEEKNPLVMKDIIEMSIYLRNVSFNLYWNYTFLKMDSTLDGSCITLHYLRDAVTKTLRQIHARDSRRRFTPPDHWLMTSEFDMTAFIKAVVLEEQDLESDDTDNKLVKRGSISTSPRLEILSNIPFVIPFEERVKIFRKFIENDRERNYHNDFFLDRRTRATIRRTHVFEDGFTHLNTLGKELKRPVAISFIDEYGLPEAGIDGGGLFKEFLTALTRQAFDVNYGLFLNTQDNLLYPSPHAYARQEQQLNYYAFLGRILGKALYEGMLVDAAFAGFFLSKWLGKLSYLDDLPSLDPDLYQGLIFLKNYKGNVEELSLNFTVVDKEFDESRAIDLIPRGSETTVTEENRLAYIFRMANYRLNTQISWQCKAFFNGLKDLIDEKWLQMFNQQELQILIGGTSTPIDVDDLRENTVYAGYSENDIVIQNFWTVIKSFTEEQRQKLVKFVTSCSRPPLLGFKQLNPKFSIRNAGHELRLPTSSTCVNLLKLPAYPDLKTMREKLEYAISVEVGFGLS
ncbi:9145_t:CDS:10 [Ambispora gerdemannii]|uniref:HECT-type E3 ubiquitin transferase n=1 Tax=Ambispora gerdemannii TaxID=144530 RepID=A0A9N8V335_9GLOM|nr:9145_t:CDS:10 [Ambispora gerdemannii]